MGRQTVYDRRQADPAFAAEWDTAYQEAMDVLEEEAKRRAFEGLIRFKFKKDGTPLLHPITGKPYCEFEYSDTLLIFLLKGGRPEKYKDRQEQQHTGTVTLFHQYDDDFFAKPESGAHAQANGTPAAYPVQPGPDEGSGMRPALG